jgi:hypothetical protein
MPEPENDMRSNVRQARASDSTRNFHHGWMSRSLLTLRYQVSAHLRTPASYAGGVER